MVLDRYSVRRYLCTMAIAETTSARLVSEKVSRPAYPEKQPTPASGTLILAFAAIYFIWGSTYLAMRFGIETIPPLLLAGTRHLVTGVFLYPLLRIKTGVRPTKGHWRTAAVTGILLLFIGNGGVCWAEQLVPSGLTALLVAMVALWLVLIEWLRPHGTRPAARVISGIAMGFGGLVLLVGPANLGGSERVNPVGAAVLVVASLSWACGSLYSKHGDMPKSPLLGAAMQSLVAGVVLWVAGLLIGEGRGLHIAAVSLRSWLGLGYLILFGSCIGFSAYIYLLKNSTPARVGTYAFVNPVVALLLGWALAGEPLTLRTGIAAAVILTAVCLVITAPHKDPAEAEEMLPAAGEA